MDVIRTIALCLYLVFLGWLAVRAMSEFRVDIRALKTKFIEFIGAWVLGISLYMEERTAVCPGR